MKEYIEREELMQSIEDNPHLPVSRLIKETPVADVAPVVHAKWRKVSDYWTCSNCSTVTRSKDDEYCRHCGAKMDGSR